MVADGWAHRGISAPSVFESHSFAAALEISRMTFLVSGSESDTESPAVARLASQEASLAAPEKGVSTKRSEEHTSELQSLMRISYAVFCLKKKKTHTNIELTMNDTTHTNNVTAID